ncbi:MAG: TlpA family protein disulfide reductase [Aeromicrobium sp.]|nr:TlpA family protein disulfide reductase [Aeromicrobium sp.]
MRRAIVVALALLVLTACGSSPTSKSPTFGGGSGTTVSADKLATAKKAAGIRACPRSDGTAPTSKALPDVTLKCLGGGTSVRLAGLTGTPTVINLWASWCGPCREELPLLARADKAYGQRVRILGVDFADAAPDAAIALAKASGVTYPSLVDRSSSIKAALRVIGLPQTVFVDAQGRMVATERGPFRSYADLTAAIRTHLGVKP